MFQLVLTFALFGVMACSRVEYEEKKDTGSDLQSGGDGAGQQGSDDATTRPVEDSPNTTVDTDEDVESDPPQGNEDTTESGDEDSDDDTKVDPQPNNPPLQMELGKIELDNPGIVPWDVAVQVVWQSEGEVELLGLDFLAEDFPILEIGSPNGNSHMVPEKTLQPGMYKVILRGKNAEGDITAERMLGILPTVGLTAASNTLPLDLPFDLTATSPSGAEEIQIFHKGQSEPFFTIAYNDQPHTFTWTADKEGAYPLEAVARVGNLRSAPAEVVVNATCEGSLLCQRQKVKAMCDQYHRQTAHIDVRLPFREGCEFGSGDNKSALNGFVRARKESLESLHLPEHAVPCRFKKTESFFDVHSADKLIMTLNDVATTSSFLPGILALPKEQGLAIYDWQKLVGNGDLRMDDYTVGYCAGPSDDQCCFPNRNDQGHKVSFFLDDDTSQRIAARGYLKYGQWNRADLGAIVLGDNDHKDCKFIDYSSQIGSFAPLEGSGYTVLFKMEIEYVIPGP